MEHEAGLEALALSLHNRLGHACVAVSSTRGGLSVPEMCVSEFRMFACLRRGRVVVCCCVRRSLQAGRPCAPGPVVAKCLLILRIACKIFSLATGLRVRISDKKGKGCMHVRKPGFTERAPE